MPLDIDPEDLLDPQRYGAKGQPHEIWTRLRREAPIARLEPTTFPPFYAVTRHADIMDISGRPEVFSNVEGPVMIDYEMLARREADPSLISPFRSIIDMDPPEHREYRNVTSGFFTPRAIHSLDRIVVDCARATIDKLGAEGETDWVEAISQRHPLRVLATILGVGPEDEELMLELTQQLFASDDPDLQRQGDDRGEATKAAIAEFGAMFERLIEDRRANPRDDVASMLANAKMADGSPMGPVETFGYFMIVFTAGHDTTRNAISGGVLAMIENPEELRKLRDHPSLVKSAVEEVVRWTSPVNYMRRHVLEDTEIGGVKMRQGEDLVMFYCSANRDEEIFEDPFRFDVTRRPNRHLGFGTGEHFCLGAHVARLSQRALFAELARRVESIELAGDPTWIASSFVVGLKSLPVRYRIRPAA